MRTLVCTSPGLLEYREADIPALQPGHAIIRIQRVGICGTDLHAFEGTQPYFHYPRILGHELAATLVECDLAPAWVPGDKVTLLPYYSCGNCYACRSGKPNCCMNLRVAGVHVDGGMADYLSVPISALIPGGGLSLDELALVEPLAIGAHAIQRAGPMKDHFVLVAGAGPIGICTMEFARLAGAKLIALDLNPGRLAFCREVLGVPFVVNGRGGHIREELLEITNGDMPAFVIDATGNLEAINQGFDWIAHGGTYILVGLQKKEIHFSHPEFHKREATLMSSRNATRKDFEEVIRILKAGQIRPLPFITHRASAAETAFQFESWLDPSNGVIKAMVNWDEE